VASSFSYDELAEYVCGLKGREVRIEARAAGASEVGVILIGELVQVYDASAPGTSGINSAARYWCEVGKDGSGFILSAKNFGSAWIHIYDSELFAVNISLGAQARTSSGPADFRIVILDERIAGFDGPLPVRTS
jgi:hypothetical protein